MRGEERGWREWKREGERGRERVERMGERVKGRKCFKFYFCFRKRMRVSKRPRERSFVGSFVSCCVGQENKGGGEKEGHREREE